MSTYIHQQVWILSYEDGCTDVDPGEVNHWVDGHPISKSVLIVDDMTEGVKVFHSLI